MGADVRPGSMLVLPRDVPFAGLMLNTLADLDLAPSRVL